MIRSCRCFGAALLLLLAAACAPSEPGPKPSGASGGEGGAGGEGGIGGPGGSGGETGMGGGPGPGGSGGSGGSGGTPGTGGSGGSGTALESTISHLEGWSGLAEVPTQIVAAADGSLWVPGYRSVVGFDPGEVTWSLDLALPLMSTRTLVAAPSGALHLLAEVGGELAWFRRGEASSAWEKMPAPPVRGDSFWRGGTVSPDGSLCLSARREAGDYAVHCASKEAEWSVAALAPNDEAIAALGFTHDGRLVMATESGNVYEFVEGEPNLAYGEWYSAQEFIRAGEALFVRGEGVLHRPAVGPWVDISEGLPTGCMSRTGKCPIFGLAALGDEVYAIASAGLFRWREGESFVRLADHPPHENVGSFQGQLLAHEGQILVGSSRGIWRYRADAADWELITRSGVEFGRFPLAMGFLPDGTEIFAAGSFADDFNHLYRRRPEDLHWTRLESTNPLPQYHDVVALALRHDGKILVGTERLRSGTGARGLLYVAEPDDDRYELLGLEGLPAWNPSSDREAVNLVAVGWLQNDAALVAIDAHGLFHLPPEATRWEPFGPETRVEALLLHPDGRILIASGAKVLALSSDRSDWVPVVEAPRGAPIRGLTADDDGALWLATDAGVYVVKGGALVSAGSGDCALSAESVFVGFGRAYCRSGEGHLAELVDGRWARIRGLSPGEHHVRPVAIGPEGSLYLLFGHSPRAALVRTRP